MDKKKAKAVKKIKKIAVENGVTFDDLLGWNKPKKEEKQDSKKVLKMKKRHKKVAEKPVGAKVKCPVCKKAFKKKAYNTIFCSGKGKGNCRDKYHNLINPVRLGARK